MGYNKKFAFILLLLSQLFFVAFLKPRISLAGTCNSGNSSYNDALCVQAENGAAGTYCDVGYPYYSCNDVGGTWQYCYGCHASTTGGCFPPGTTIKNPTGGTQIQSIEAGDTVTSFNDRTNKIENSSVSNIYEVQRTFYFSLIAGGYHVTVTAEHPFFTGNGKYKEAQELKTGDILYVDQNNVLVPTVVAANIRINEPTSAYNLTVDNAHTFFANDFAVHNKGCPCGSTRITSCAKSCPKSRQSGFCGWAKDGSEKDWCTINFCKVCSTCLATSPSGITITPTSTTSSLVSWTPGTGGVSQQIYIGDDSTAVTSLCPGGSAPGSGCVYINTSLPATQSSLATGNILSAGTVYYYKIVNFDNSSCSSTGALATAVSSCVLSPSALTMKVGDAPVTLTTTVNSSSSISSVDYSSSNTGVAIISPASDTTYVYQTTVSAVAPGSSIITSTTNVTGGAQCKSNSAIKVIQPAPPGPWWQVKDGDVIIGGDLNSAPPGANLFDLAGDGGYPGIPIYSRSTNLTNSNVSAKGWLVNTAISSLAVYNSTYFENLIPADTLANINTVDPGNVPTSLLSAGATHDSNNYYWFEYNGNKNGNTALTIPTVNLGTRKVILLVKSADLNITGNINVTDGSGFFMVIVSQDANKDANTGNINVDPGVGGGGVANLEGIYLADNSFSDGTNAPGYDTELWIRGSVAAYKGLSLRRNLGEGNFTSPADSFQYAPDQIMLFPKVLGTRKILWKEVAP